jgi:hypothetical protein
LTCQFRKAVGFAPALSAGDSPRSKSERQRARELCGALGAPVRLQQGKCKFESKYNLTFDGGYITVS